MNSDQPILPELLAGRVTMIEKKGKKLIPEIIPEIPGWRYRMNFIRARIISMVSRVTG